ncbi:MAG: hypothetical protein HYR72_01435 [Deltaproteobacteria bacterium]|nr:hypothetical protein [Deltaproteobacteria bacterium]MBI3391078.1 hypothetical protein [Deltaproteobacteria bacterium]
MRRKSGSALAQIGLLEAVRRILTPLARAATREGIGAAAFVAAASDAMAASAGAPRLAPSIDYEIGLRLAGHWLSDRRYSIRGRPRVLLLRGRGSFAELAASVSADPTLVLAQLAEVGAVRVTRGRVALTEMGYVPIRGLSEKLDILGRDAAEFVETVIHNLSANPSGSRFQRKASYDNIGAVALPALRRRLCNLAMRALLEGNSALAGVDRDRNPKSPGGRRTRVSFGIYLAEENLTTKSRAQDRPRAARRTKGTRR